MATKKQDAATLETKIEELLNPLLDALLTGNFDEAHKHFVACNSTHAKNPTWKNLTPEIAPLLELPETIATTFDIALGSTIKVDLKSGTRQLLIKKRNVKEKIIQRIFGV